MTGHVLIGLAGSLAVAHTAIGIDHTVPFVVLSRVQKWSLRRTLVVTALCGVGHVLSAVILGLGAMGLGVAVERFAPFEALRGRIVVWLLIVLGLAYAALGVMRAYRRKPHTHGHHHGDGTHHEHEHGHHDEHVHLHDHHAEARKRTVTAWTLFVVLVFGPCEALIPLLLAPGVTHDWRLLIGIITVFGALTIATMLVLVTVALLGLRLVRLERLTSPRLAHATDIIAGLAIACTGVAVGLFGL